MSLDETVKQIIVFSPFAGIFLLLLIKVYDDAKKERDTRNAKYDTIDEKLDDIKERIVRLELVAFGEKFPTQSKRKNDPRNPHNDAMKG